MSWRLIYNNRNKKVYGLFESDGVTHTRQTVLVSKTLEGCFDVMDGNQLVALWPSGTTTDILFSGGTRTLVKSRYPEDTRKKSPKKK